MLPLSAMEERLASLGGLEKLIRLAEKDDDAAAWIRLMRTYFFALGVRPGKIAVSKELEATLREHATQRCGNLGEVLFDYCGDLLFNRVPIVVRDE